VHHCNHIQPYMSSLLPTPPLHAPVDTAALSLADVVDPAKALAQLEHQIELKVRQCSGVGS